VLETKTTYWLYCAVGLFLWVSFVSFLPEINPWLLLAVAIPLTVIILSFVVIPLGFVQKWLHKQWLIKWDSVEKAEAKKSEITFYLKQGIFKQNQLKLTIIKGHEEEANRFLSLVLKDRFVF
jgi:hypothetical protein